MADVILTPNMNLPNPVPSVDEGPDYANNIENSLNILDAHNHSSGSGVAITPAGLNINADLPLNGNNSTTVRSTRYTAQSAALAQPTDVGCVYVSGVDLYYNDINGSQIRITSGAAVNATSSGISSGTATASFVAGVLVVNQASNTPANIKGGSVLVGNNVAASKFATVSAPNSLAADYTLTLPQVPAATSFMTLDASGNMVANVSTTNGVAQSNLYKRTTGTSVTAGNVAVSNSSVAFSTTSTSFVDVTNLSITIVTTGRPLRLELVNDGTGNQSAFYTTSASGAELSLIRDGATGVGLTAFGLIGATNQINFANTIFLDLPSAGSHTYKLQVKNVTAGTTQVTSSVLVAYEL